MANSLTLPPDLAAKVQARIDSGAANDAVEVLRAGIDALEAADAVKLEAVRARVARALADPRASTPSEQAFDRIDALLNALDRK